jgi:hypothetical protein
VGVEPDDRETVVSHRESLDRADVGAAAAAEYERALGQRGGQREVLLGQRVLVDDGRLGVGERQESRLDHLLAPVTPGAGDAHEAGEEGAAAGVAFVVALAQRYSGERVAVGAAGPQMRHA